MSLFPTLRAKVNGKIVEIPVCWTREKVESETAKFPQGFVDIDEMMSDSYKGTATMLEREWFKAMAEKFAGKGL